MSQTQINPKKIQIVNQLVEDLKSHKTIGIVEMESIGAKTVQKLRADLRSRARIVVAKNTLMKKALEKAGIPGGELLVEHIRGSRAFLFSNSSPYSIANYLDKNKVSAPAKGGQISPISVTVPKLNTGLPPGTIISLLNSVGLPTRIEGGTVAVPEDTQVLEPGDKISATLANVLSQLGIEPFMVGLSLDMVLENGEIIMHDDLIIDFDQIRNDLIYAYKAAISVSLETGYLTSDSAPQVIGSAHSKALGLASEIGWLSEETAPRVLATALSKAKALEAAIQKVDASFSSSS